MERDFGSAIHNINQQVLVEEWREETRVKQQLATS